MCSAFLPMVPISSPDLLNSRLLVHCLRHGGVSKWLKTDALS